MWLLYILILLKPYNIFMSMIGWNLSTCQTTLDFACDDHWQKHYFWVKWSLIIFTRPLNLNMTTAFGTLHLVRREGGCGIDCRKQMNESLVESRQWEDTRIKSRTFISFTTIDFQTPQAVLLWRFPSRWDSYIGMYFSTLWLCRDAGTLCSFLRVEGKLFQTSY